MHQGLYRVEAYKVPCVVEHSYSRDHRVHPTTETGKHLPRVVYVPGLAEDLLLQNDHRIRSQHDCSGALLGDVLGFGVCHPPGIGPGHFIGPDTFIDVRRENGERDGQLRE